MVDISANLFCVAFVIFTIMLELYVPLKASQTRDTALSDVTSLNHAVHKQKVHLPAEFVTMLHERTQLGHHSIDMMPRGVFLKTANQKAGEGIFIEMQGAGTLTKLQKALSKLVGDVDVFVFSHTNYDATMEALQLKQWHLREMCPR